MYGLLKVIIVTMDGQIRIGIVCIWKTIADHFPWLKKGSIYAVKLHSKKKSVNSYLTIY